MKVQVETKIIYSIDLTDCKSFIEKMEKVIDTSLPNYSRHALKITGDKWFLLKFLEQLPSEIFPGKGASYTKDEDVADITLFVFSDDFIIEISDNRIYVSKRTIKYL